MGVRPSQKPLLTILASRATRYLFLLVMLGLAVHLILPQITTLENSYQVIKNLVIWAVLLAVAAQVLSYFGSGYLLKALVRISDSTLSLWNGTMMTLAGASLGMVAGGIVGTSAALYRWMQKENVRPETATLAGTIPALFNNLILVAVSLVGLIHLLIVHQLSRLQGISFVLILTFLLSLLILLLWGLRKRDSLRRFANHLGQRWASFRHQDYQPQEIDQWLDGLFNAADMLLAGKWRGPLMGALLNVAFDVLTIYFLFIAAGNRVSLGLVLTGYGLPLLLGKIAFMVPGGVGVVETAMVALYTGLGVPASVAVVVVMAYRVISFWLPLILGFPLIMVFQKRKNNPMAPKVT